MKLFLLGAPLLVLVSGGCGQPKTSSGPANSPAVAVSNHLAAIAAAGEPVTLDQLSRMYEEPPAAQNAAPLSKLVEIASLGQAFDGLQESLNQKSFTDAELLRLLTALRDAEAAVGFRRAMLGERANLVAAFQSSDEKLAEAMAMSEGGSSAPPSMLRIYRSGGHLEGDFAFALDFMSNLVAVVALPYPQALDAAAGMKIPDYPTVLGEKLLVSAALLPEPARFVSKAAEAVARIRLARTALAVERYRLKHDGALPTSLADVSAELPGGVPEDPFDGQPLRYKKLPARGYAVYSMGGDRKDDGGEVREPDGKTPPDVGMIIIR